NVRLETLVVAQDQFFSVLTCEDGTGHHFQPDEFACGKVGDNRVFSSIRELEMKGRPRRTSEKLGDGDGVLIRRERIGLLPVFSEPGIGAVEFQGNSSPREAGRVFGLVTFPTIGVVALDIARSHAWERLVLNDQPALE